MVALDDLGVGVGDRLLEVGVVGVDGLAVVERDLASGEALDAGTDARCPAPSRWPRTYVPFALPRSSRKSSSPTLTMCACFEDTCG